MTRERKLNIGYLIAVFVLLGLYQAWLASQSVVPLAYSDLMRLVGEGRIAEVTVTESSVRGTFTAPQDGKRYFVATRVDPVLAAEFEKAGVKVSGGSDSNWL